VMLNNIQHKGLRVITRAGAQFGASDRGHGSTGAKESAEWHDL
jgi:hypothetical protein